MRKTRILPILLLFSIFINAQDNKVNLISSTIDESLLDFTFQSYDFKTVTTPQGEAVIVVAENLNAIMEKGAPDLPKFTSSLIIPDRANMQVMILASKFTDVKNVNVAPSKGNFTRNIDPATVAYEYGKMYDKDAFYPNELAVLNNPYIIRDYRGQALQVFPFQYNPITKTLRVYSEIKLKVSVKNQDGINPFERTNSFTKVAKEYNKIYSEHFINFQASQSRYTPLEEEGNMLIICYDDWTAEMESFVAWKNTIGRPCEMVSVTDAGATAANIKTYVENYYNTNGLTYLLLVGDAEQVPTNTGSVGGVTLGGQSDNAYGYITGSDHYQELFVGRFSAEDVAQVTTQVQRTLEYEMGDQLAADWLNKLMSVGSDQGPGDDGEMDYEHLRNMQTDLLGFTYENPPYEHFDGSQGGEDAAGDPSPSDVAASLNAGLGIANYTGHGSSTEWVSSGFSISDINNLTNDNKLPFIWSVACINGAFVGQTCFGEAWLRAENTGEPTGAIAIMASTINQSWAPPMVAQDEMVDLLVGASTNGIKRTYAGLSINGCFLMNDETSDFAMIDTWTCFGDPSLYVRTDNVSDMTISHNSVVIVGETVFNVTCDLEGALATISNDGVIVGSAVVAGGNAAIPVSGLVPGTELTLAVVGFNKKTYLSTINVIALSGSYLIMNSCVDAVTFGQSIDLDMSLKNVGVDDAFNVTATVSTTDAAANITNPTYSYGTILAGAVSPASTDALTLTVSDAIQDQYMVELNLEMTDDSDTWTTATFVRVNAPEFEINTLSIDDSATGNGDGVLDPEETVTLTVEATNTGHAAITNVLSILTTTSTDLVIDTANAPIVDLAIGETKSFDFTVTANADVSPGTTAALTNTITGGVNGQYNSEKEFSIIIGFVPVYCEAGSNNTTDEFIQQVLFVDIDNSSTQGPSYTDYTNISTNIQVGESYDITIINGESFSSEDQMGCWIDWNYDGDFDDANEVFVITYQHDIPSAGLGTGTGTITVPVDARLGVARMRLRVLYTGAIESCGNTSYGEVEDYTVNVFDPLSITDNNLANINLYPNPNEGSFIVDLSNIEDLNNTLIEVFDLKGQLVYKSPATQLRENIQLNAVSGVYLVRITSGKQIANKKIIVK